MLRNHFALVAAVLSLAPILGHAKKVCSTTTVTNATPTKRPVALKEFSYCGGTLETVAYIENLCYNKIVQLVYTDGSGDATPLTNVELNYRSSIDSGYELWGATTGYVNYDGISKLANLTFNAVDIKEVYHQKLNRAVTPSGAKPTTSVPPAPYATPTGFSDDITDWLAATQKSQAGISKRRMFNNIEVTDAANGTIVAAQSYANPDYGYNWVRDSSLTMDVVASLYGAATNRMRQTYEDLFFRYAQARATQQLDPTVITGLGEPKFNLDNTAFTGPWGRPQNDGPATAAITFMEFAYAYMAKGGPRYTIKDYIYDSKTYPKRAPVMKDLLFVARNWTSPSFDLWEEEKSDHFYTRMVQHRALVMGTKFSKAMGDSKTSAILSRQAKAIAATLSQFWDPNRKLILYEYGPVLRGKYSYKDAAILLGLIHGYADDGIYSYSNPRVLGSAFQIATSFIPIYNISKTHTDSKGLPLGIPVGRYPEDVYDGVGTSKGNAWYLCTATLAEVMYRAAMEFQKARQIKITKASKDFWTYFAPQVDLTTGNVYTASGKEYKQMISSLQGWGDAFLRTIKYYTPKGGHLSEEINRDTGKAVGAIDLTWSYASLLTAAFARAEATGETTYAKTLANLYVQTNSTYT